MVWFGFPMLGLTCAMISFRKLINFTHSIFVVRATQENEDTDNISVNTGDFGVGYNTTVQGRDEYSVAVSVQTNDFAGGLSQTNVETPV